MTKISAVINTRNEQDNIRNCLETVKWCDEIIIVDMESEDKTVAIAKEYTSKIFVIANTGYVEPARDYAVQQATGDWILLIDADEMISKALALTLMKISRENEVDVVEIPVKQFIMGDHIKHTGWGRTLWVKFFKKNKIKFSSVIHHGLIRCDDAITLTLPPLEENYLYHFNYIDSFHFVAKLNTYTNVEAQQLYEQKVPITKKRLIMSSVREFLSRFILEKGYKDGMRGFSLSLLMAFYRALTHIKLWERNEYGSDPVSDRYEQIKQKLIATWKEEKR